MWRRRAVRLVTVLAGRCQTSKFSPTHRTTCSHTSRATAVQVVGGAEFDGFGNKLTGRGLSQLCAQAGVWSPVTGACSPAR